jgi:hypothetical protein
MLLASVHCAIESLKLKAVGFWNVYGYLLPKMYPLIPARLSFCNWHHSSVIHASIFANYEATLLL